MTASALSKPGLPRSLVIAWVVLLAFETLAQLGLKAGGDGLSEQVFGLRWLVLAIADPWVQAGVVGYLGAFAAWMTILDRVPLSFAFPLTAMIMIVVVAASYVVFGETISVMRGIGIALIVGGVVMVGRSDH